MRERKNTLITVFHNEISHKNARRDPITSPLWNATSSVTLQAPWVVIYCISICCWGISNNKLRRNLVVKISHNHIVTWWHHQMDIFSALLALCAGNSPVSGEFPCQRPVTRSFDAFFDLRLNKRLSKQSRGWWSETPPRSLWRQCNEMSRISVTLQAPWVAIYCISICCWGISSNKLRRNLVVTICRYSSEFIHMPHAEKSITDDINQSSLSCTGISCRMLTPRLLVLYHYNNVIMGAMGSQITSLTIV